jgi:hypothetical protein
VLVLSRPIEQLDTDISRDAKGFLPDNALIRSACYVRPMNYGMVKIVLEQAISSPAEFELAELHEAI